LKIGDGAPEERDKIIELVAGSFNDVQIVDEACTSKSRKHEDSAVEIARG